MSGQPRFSFPFRLQAGPVQFMICRAILAAGMTFGILAPHTAVHAAGDAQSGSGLPIPRFVSLKADRVNVRGGPAKDHEVSWVYTRAGLPVEITAEFDNWRRIRDWEGSEGWVYHSLLSGRRTAVVTAREKDDLVPLMAEPETGGAVTAKLQSGVLSTVKTCNGSWCRIAGQGFDGWVPQERLWGVYPNEKID